MRIRAELRIMLRFGAAAFSILLGALLSGCADPERPNVLLISLDTLRPDHLSCYGGNRATPGIDTLSRNGVRFENAYSTSPWTIPAHASMLSGLYPSSLDDDANSLDLFRRARLLSSILEEHGYTTGAVTGGMYLGRKFGLAKHFQDFAQFFQKNGLPRAREWLEEHAQEPFFLFFHTYVVHAPYKDRRFVLDLDGARLGRIYENGRVNESHYEVCCKGLQPTDAEREFLLGLYDGGVAAADFKVKRLWRTLGELGLREKTLVIVTSDHGEEFWEHTGRAAYHGHTLYDELLRIPLIWVDPARPGESRVVHEPVSLVDIVPSILGRLGIDSGDVFDGVDLTPLIDTGQWEAKRVLLAEGSRNGPERKSARSATGKLIVTPHPGLQNGEGKIYPVPVLAPIEFYAAQDTGERNNLVHQETLQVEALMQHLAPRIRRMPQDQSEHSVESLDEATRRELRALGYAE